jgi:hypothetical protein
MKIRRFGWRFLPVCSHTCRVVGFRYCDALPRARPCRQQTATHLFPFHTAEAGVKWKQWTGGRGTQIDDPRDLRPKCNFPHQLDPSTSWGPTPFCSASRQTKGHKSFKLWSGLFPRTCACEWVDGCQCLRVVVTFGGRGETTLLTYLKTIPNYIPMSEE